MKILQYLTIIILIIVISIGVSADDIEISQPDSEANLPQVFLVVNESLEDWQSVELENLSAEQLTQFATEDLAQLCLVSNQYSYTEALPNVFEDLIFFLFSTSPTVTSAAEGLTDFCEEFFQIKEGVYSPRTYEIRGDFAKLQSGSNIRSDGPSTQNPIGGSTTSEWYQLSEVEDTLFTLSEGFNWFGIRFAPDSPEPEVGFVTRELAVQKFAIQPGLQPHPEVPEADFLPTFAGMNVICGITAQSNGDNGHSIADAFDLIGDASLTVLPFQPFDDNGGEDTPYCLVTKVNDLGETGQMLINAIYDTVSGVSITNSFTAISPENTPVFNICRTVEGVEHDGICSVLQAGALTALQNDSLLDNDTLNCLLNASISADADADLFTLFTIDPDITSFDTSGCFTPTADN